MNNPLLPLVSVCVQTYQHGHYIKECLDSILMQQTNFPFEIILGEDESTDGTREICLEYAKMHPDTIRLFLRSRKDVIYINGNPTGRFNVMENLKAAKGKYIALCEGDDYWTDPIKLQKQVDFLEQHDEYSGSFHDTLFVDETSADINSRLWREYEKNHYNLEDTISTVALFHTSSFIFRVSSLSLPDWFVKVQSADMALFTLIASRGFLYRLPETMSVYRKNSGGLTKKINQVDYHRNRIYLFQQINLFLQGEGQQKIESIIGFHKQELDKLEDKGFLKKIKSFFNK